MEPNESLQILRRILLLIAAGLALHGLGAAGGRTRVTGLDNPPAGSKLGPSPLFRVHPGENRTSTVKTG